MDRRTVWAILVMMAIAIAPALLIKRPRPERRTRRTTLTGDSAGRRGLARPGPGRTVRRGRQRAPDAAATPAGPTSAAAEDTVAVTSPLYSYGVSTPWRPPGLGRAAAVRLDGTGREGPAGADPPAGRRSAGSHPGGRPGHGLLRSGPLQGVGRRAWPVSRPDAAPALSAARRGRASSSPTPSTLTITASM